MENGDCFQAAAQRLVSPGFPDAVLVHGTPMNAGHPVHKGKRYWHAWIEVGDMVYDFSNGKRVRISKADYYRLGEITEEHVHRYERETARSILLRTQNYGPWVSGWRKLARL